MSAIAPAGQLPRSNIAEPSSPIDASTDTTFAYLTPNALMSYCGARLRNLDTQIQQGVARQRQANADQQALEGVASTLAKYAGGANDTQSVKELEDSVNGAANQISQDSPGKAGMQKMQKDIQSAVTYSITVCGIPVHLDGLTGTVIPPDQAGALHCSLDSDKIQGFSTSLNDITSTINSAAELEMINLQSLMSQRQSAVEMTTNMVQTLGDTLGKVVQNVGR